jgi:hypothetical protein
MAEPAPKLPNLPKHDGPPFLTGDGTFGSPSIFTRSAAVAMVGTQQPYWLLSI